MECKPCAEIITNLVNTMNSGDTTSNIIDDITSDIIDEDLYEAAVKDRHVKLLDDEHILLKYQIPIEDIDKYAKRVGKYNPKVDEMKSGKVKISRQQMKYARNKRQAKLYHPTFITGDIVSDSSDSDHDDNSIKGGRVNTVPGEPLASQRFKNIQPKLYTSKDLGKLDDSTNDGTTKDVADALYNAIELTGELNSIPESDRMIIKEELNKVASDNFPNQIPDDAMEEIESAIYQGISDKPPPAVGDVPFMQKHGIVSPRTKRRQDALASARMLAEAYQQEIMTHASALPKQSLVIRILSKLNKDPHGVDKQRFKILYIMCKKIVEISDIDVVNLSSHYDNFTKSSEEALDKILLKYLSKYNVMDSPEYKYNPILKYIAVVKHTENENLLISDMEINDLDKYYVK